MKIDLGQIFSYTCFSKSLKNWDSDLETILSLTELRKLGVFYMSPCVVHRPLKIKFLRKNKEGYLVFEENGKECEYVI